MWAAPSLEARQDNPRLVYRELAIKRGKIISADGVTLATNTPRPAPTAAPSTSAATRARARRPPIVGYSSVQASRAGVERSRNDYLTGANTDLAGGVERLFDTVRGQTVTGNDVILSLDAGAQRIAMRALTRQRPQRGAVVALEPSTGRILVMASWPTYDPNLVDTDFASVLDQRRRAAAQPRDAGPLPARLDVQDRDRRGGARVAASSTPESEFKGGKCVKTQGPPLCNASGEVAPDPNTLADALVHSYNTTFAQIGQQLGQDRLVEQMQAFGFYSPIPIDYPREQMATSGIYRRPGQIADPDRKVDVSRVAIGQAGLLATPLQMAMVTATIANGGVMMAPRRSTAIRSPSGRVVSAPSNETIGSPISPQTASTLTGIMQRVVDEGTGPGGADRRPAGGRQDGHRADRPQGLRRAPAVRRLVRRVRARVGAQGRDRRRDRGLHRLRRHRRRTGRARHPE